MELITGTTASVPGKEKISVSSNVQKDYTYTRHGADVICVYFFSATLKSHVIAVVAGFGFIVAFIFCCCCSVRFCVLFDCLFAHLFRWLYV